MSIRKLAATLTKADKGKSQDKIGDTTEMLAKLSDIIYQEDWDFEEGFENYPTYKMLLANGKRRAKKKKK